MFKKTVFCFLLVTVIFLVQAQETEKDLLNRIKELENRVNLLEKTVALMEKRIESLESQLQKENLKPTVKILAPEPNATVDNFKTVLKATLKNAYGLKPIVSVKPLMVGKSWIQAQVTNPKNNDSNEFQALVYVGEAELGKGESFEISVFLVPEKDNRFKEGQVFDALPEDVVALTSVVINRK